MLVMVRVLLRYFGRSCVSANIPSLRTVCQLLLDDLLQMLGGLQAFIIAVSLSEPVIPFCTSTINLARVGFLRMARKNPEACTSYLAVLASSPHLQRQMWMRSGTIDSCREEF